MKEIIRMKFGSHLYGTNTPNSDLDLKAIYIPTAKQILLGTAKETINLGKQKEHKERNTKDDVDVEIFSLQRFMNLLMDGQTVALDMIFAPKEMWLPLGTNKDCWTSLHPWNELRKNRDKLINKNVNAFIGYARQQSSRYGIKGSRMDALKQVLELLKPKNPYSKLGDCSEDIADLVVKNKEVVSLEGRPIIWLEPKLSGDKQTQVMHLSVCGKFFPFGQAVKDVIKILQTKYDEYGARSVKAHLDGGKDFKALSHAVRVNCEGLELLKTGNITFPRPEKDLLLKIKKGEMDWNELSELIEQGLSDLVDASLKSTLRDEPDREWADNFLVSVYGDEVTK